VDSDVRALNRWITAAVVLLSLLLSGCLRRTLVTGLSEVEAQEVAVALYKGDLRASVSKQPKSRGQAEEKWQVEIDGGNRTQVEAWRILQENGLPRHRDSGVEEVYKTGQVIPTASEERAKFLFAQSGELGRTLKTIPGVVDARVHVVIPDPSALRDPTDKPHPTASVLLKYWANYAEPQREQVARLVANGVEGLDEKNISVMVTKLQQPTRNQVEELRKAVTPTVSLIVDYVCYIAGIVGVFVGIWLLFGLAPGWIRWAKTQFALLKESLAE
jgi:type III secretion protein J